VFSFGSTKCGKCDGSTFKLQVIEVQDAAFKMYAIQCTGCQTPIGVAPYYDSGALLKKQESTIATLATKLLQMENTVNQIARALNGMRR
jgi:hypothetical protein